MFQEDEGVMRAGEMITELEEFGEECPVLVHVPGHGWFEIENVRLGIYGSSAIALVEVKEESI